MILTYNTDTREDIEVYDLEEPTPSMLRSGKSIILCPDNLKGYALILDKNRESYEITENGVLYKDGATYYTFSEVKNYLLKILVQKANKEVDKFLDLCIDHVFTYIEQISLGVTISYPVQLINPSNGNVIVANNSDGLLNAYRSMVASKQSSLSTILTKFSKIRRDIESATTISELNLIKIY